MLKTTSFFAVIAALMISLFYVTLTSADTLLPDQLLGHTLTRSNIPADGRSTLVIPAPWFDLCQSQESQDSLTDAILTLEGLTVRVIQASMDHYKTNCVFMVEHVYASDEYHGDTFVNVDAPVWFTQYRNGNPALDQSVVMSGKVLQEVKTCDTKGRCDIVAGDYSNIIVTPSVCSAMAHSRRDRVKFDGLAGWHTVDYAANNGTYCILQLNDALSRMPKSDAAVWTFIRDVE